MLMELSNLLTEEEAQVMDLPPIYRICAGLYSSAPQDHLQKMDVWVVAST